jgi:hypothetical protein
MTPDEYENKILRSRNELPYPLNYLAYQNPMLAITMIMLKDKGLL